MHKGIIYPLKIKPLICPPVQFKGMSQLDSSLIIDSTKIFKEC